MLVYFRMCGTSEVHEFEIDREHDGRLYEKDGAWLPRSSAYFTREGARNHAHEDCVSCEATGPPYRKRVVKREAQRMASDLAEQAAALANLLAAPDNF